MENPNRLVNSRHSAIRVDHMLIAGMIKDRSRVLDIGCNEGELLELLANEKQVDARGLELSMAGVRKAVARGLSVVQGDAEADLAHYPDGAFDYAILSDTLQTMHHPRELLEELLRIGNRVIVSIPNFAHFTARLDLLFHGRMPVTKALPYQWWNTPNIHFCTISDFVTLCDEMNIFIEQGFALDAHGKIMRCNASGMVANLLAQQAVFMLKKL